MDPVWEWGRRTCSSTVPDSSQRRHGEVRPLAVLVDDVRGVLVPLTHGGPQEKGTTTRQPSAKYGRPKTQIGHLWCGWVGRAVSSAKSNVVREN